MTGQTTYQQLQPDERLMIATMEQQGCSLPSSQSHISLVLKPPGQDAF